ncbi:MAG TPA: hypothetical protein ENN53_04525 [Candidatus Acetothermia bacterium]|nr:hypothetical protein [Candidatus Acetothermia bacterium]
MIAWAFTRQHAVAHSAIQAILVIAYLPVVRRLWRAERNTESFTMWIRLMVAPAFSLLSSRGVLATAYAVRAIVCTGLLLLLMIRADLRHGVLGLRCQREQWALPPSGRWKTAG